MSNYRLVFFNFTGRAEPIRWLFSFVEQEFEDERIDPHTDWAEKKNETPYGKLPILYVDDEFLSDSVSICRYLGQKHDLVPEDPWDNAIGEEVVSFLNDLVPTFGKMIWAKASGNEDEAERLTNELKTMILPPTLSAIENRLEGREWLGGDKMTWMDIYAGSYLTEIKEKELNLFEDCPNIISLVEKVVEIPQIQKWIEDRPASMM